MKILRIAVVLFAITLAVLFIRDRHYAGNTAHSISRAHPSVADPEKEDVWLIARGLQPAPEISATLIVDRFGDGGLVTLDSLIRRVHHEQFMLYSSKVLVIKMPRYKEEWRYLDSLLDHHPTGSDATQVVDSLDRGAMFRPDSIAKRQQMLGGSKSVIMVSPWNDQTELDSMNQLYFEKYK